MTAPIPDETMGPPPGGSGLSRRFGGMPVWAIIAVVAGGGLLYLWWRNHNASTASTNTAGADTTDTSTTDGLATDQYEALLAQLRDIQGSASTPGPAGPAGPAGPPGAPGTNGSAGNKPTPPPTARKSVIVVPYKNGQPGDTPSTLSKIVQYAKEHGVTTTVPKLQTLNHLNGTTIHPGERIYYT